MTARVRPVGGNVQTLSVQADAAVNHGDFAVINPADGSLDAVGAAVTGQVVVACSDMAIDDTAEVWTEGEFAAVNGSGGALFVGDFVVPSSSDPRTVDAGTSGDVLALRVTKGGADGATVHVRLDPDPAGTVS